jgi:hypothetical protein
MKKVFSLVVTLVIMFGWDISYYYITNYESDYISLETIPKDAIREGLKLDSSFFKQEAKASYKLGAYLNEIKE